jgi:hypothetical protein
MARLFDTTVADYTMGSPTFGKPLGNVLVGGGTRARSDDLVRALWSECSQRCDDRQP